MTELMFSVSLAIFASFYYFCSVFHNKVNIFYKKQVLYEKPVCLVAVFLHECW